MVQFGVKLETGTSIGSIRFKRMQWKEISLAILAGSLGLGHRRELAAFQDEVNDKPKDKKDNGSKRETLAKPMTEKEARRKAEKLKKELIDALQEVAGRRRHLHHHGRRTQGLQEPEHGREREQFIEQFWLRRDPTPDTVENEFKEEHYRRIAYANERYASGIPGWKTDRGRIYITYGPPDEIESHPRAAPTTGRWKKAADRRPPTPSSSGLSLPGGDRHERDHRIRRYDDERRVPHDDGPVGEGRAAVRAGRGPDDERAVGPVH